MSDQTAIERAQESYLKLVAIRRSEELQFAALADELQTLIRENMILRAQVFPDGAGEMMSPPAMILRAVATWYGRRDGNGDSEVAEEWATHMGVIDAIIGRLDRGDEIGPEDLLELQWWYNAVILSSRVLPNVVTSAFLDIMNELAARWGWPPTRATAMPSPM